MHFGLSPKHDFSSKSRKFAPIYRGTHWCPEDGRQRTEDGRMKNLEFRITNVEVMAKEEDWENGEDRIQCSKLG